MQWPATITQPELAWLLSLSTRQIRNLTGPVLHPVRKSRKTLSYPLVESISAFISYREALMKRPADQTTITQPNLALLLGITPRLVRNLTGLVFKIVHRDENIVFYPLHESVHAYVKYRDKKARERCRRAIQKALDLPDQHPP